MFLTTIINIITSLYRDLIEFLQLVQAWMPLIKDFEKVNKIHGHLFDNVFSELTFIRFYVIFVK